MGYYTSFELDYSVKGTSFTSDEIDNEILKMHVFDGDSKYGWHGCLKWYDHQEDMAYLSTRFPGVLFTLYGDGDESDDIWYEYYKSGSMQRCPARITFDDYDESRLEPVFDTSEEEMEEYQYSYA